MITYYRDTNALVYVTQETVKDILTYRWKRIKVAHHSGVVYNRDIYMGVWIPSEECKSGARCASYGTYYFGMVNLSLRKNIEDVIVGVLNRCNYPVLDVSGSAVPKLRGHKKKPKGLIARLGIVRALDILIWESRLAIIAFFKRAYMFIDRMGEGIAR
jgi:hypothetical protein